MKKKKHVMKLGHPMIELPVGPLLAAITWINNFLFDLNSLSHHSGGIFFLFFFTTLLQFIEVWGHLFMHSSDHSISVRMSSGMWLDYCNPLILLFSAGLL